MGGKWGDGQWVDQIWDLSVKKAKVEFRGLIWLNDAEREGSKVRSG